jgi:hypothetical protein
MFLCPFYTSCGIGACSIKLFTVVFLQYQNALVFGNVSPFFPLVSSKSYLQILDLGRSDSGKHSSQGDCIILIDPICFMVCQYGLEWANKVAQIQ